MKDTLKYFVILFVISFVVTTLVGRLTDYCISNYSGQKEPASSVTETVVPSEVDISDNNISDNSVAEIFENNISEAIENRPLTVAEEINRQRTKAEDNFKYKMTIFAIVITCIIGILVVILFFQ